jgi:hypothetical protein
MAEAKALNMELIPQDPVYTAVTIGLLAPGEEVNLDFRKKISIRYLLLNY